MDNEKAQPEKLRFLFYNYIFPLLCLIVTHRR